MTRYWTLLNIGNMFIEGETSDRNILTNTAFEEKKIFSTAYSTSQVSKKIKHCSYCSVIGELICHNGLVMSSAFPSAKSSVLQATNHSVVPTVIKESE